MISQIISDLEPSPTLLLAARAKELKSQGEDVVSLTVGEPDWPTYDAIKEAGFKAIRENITKYTPASGETQLREAIAMQQSEWMKIPYSAASVTVTAGAKFTLFSALYSTVNPGDEVIVPAPFWVSYPAMVQLCRGRSIVIQAKAVNNFKITAPELESAITPSTKVFMFNSPSNPTGMVYSEQELNELADVLRKNPHVVVLSDDIYNQLMLDPKEKLAPHLLHVAPDLKDRVISVNGASKAYSMTGWRIGWAIAPVEITKAMTNFQSQALGCASSISQYAALTAITSTDGDLARALENLRTRFHLAHKLFSNLPGLKVYTPDAAFYLWISIEDIMGKTYRGSKINGSRDFSHHLLESERVALVPGLEFGCEGYFRMSFAVSERDLERSADRVRKFLNELQ
jgi:aspartate aminotransferase